MEAFSIFSCLHFMIRFTSAYLERRERKRSMKSVQQWRVRRERKTICTHTQTQSRLKKGTQWNCVAFFTGTVTFADSRRDPAQPLCAHWNCGRGALSVFFDKTQNNQRKTSNRTKSTRNMYAIICLAIPTRSSLTSSLQMSQFHRHLQYIHSRTFTHYKR